MSAIGIVLEVGLLGTSVPRVVNHRLHLTLVVPLAPSRLGVEDLEEVLFDGRYLLLLLEVLLDVSDLEVVLEVVPLLLGLVIIREDELLHLEFRVHVFKILMQRIYEELIIAALNGGVHVELTDRAIQVHVVELEA